MREFSDMSLPRVSVVTPSFNQAEFLETTMRSVLNQDYPSFEYLLEDGGSTDGSVDIIRRYSPRLAYWTSEPDCGQADAINRGFAKASGEILAWLNSDDAYEPGAVRAAGEAFRAHPEADALYGDCAYVDHTGALLTVFRAQPFDLAAYLRTEGFIHQPTVFLRRRVLDRVGPLDPSFSLCLDYEYWLRMAVRCRWLYLPRVLARFRVHPAAKSTARKRGFLDERLRSLDRLFATPDLPAEVWRARKRAYAVAHLSGGVQSYEAEEFPEAWERLRAALGWDPTPFHWGTLKALALMLDLLTGLRVGKWMVDLHLRGRWAQRRGEEGAS
jgi:glycosyltransferase involved in cell wall biosynthesis